MLAITLYKNTESWASSMTEGGKISPIRNLQESMTNSLSLLERVCSWLVACLGILLSAFGLVKGDSLSVQLSAIMLIADSVILIILGCTAAVWGYRNKMEIAQLNEQHEWKISEMKRNHDDNLKNCSEIKSLLEDKIESKTASMASIIHGYDHLVQLQVKAMYDLDEIANKRWIDLQNFEQIEDGLSEPSDDRQRQKLEFFYGQATENADRTRRDFFKANNRFLSQLTDRLKVMVESYLTGQGITLDVSVAIKLYRPPRSREECISDGMKRCVFTAFRDSNSWIAKRHREYPVPLWATAGNSDFDACIKGDGYFIFNNKTRESTDFHNESSNFGTYYNCGATAIISAAGSIGVPQAEVYGFVACDVKNDDSRIRPMDENVGHLMVSAGNLLALYYGHVYMLWEDLSLDVEQLDVPDSDETEPSFFNAYYNHISLIETKDKELSKNE